MVNSNKANMTENINQTALVTFNHLLIISHQLEVFSRLLTLIALFFGLMASWFLNSVLLTSYSLVSFLLGLISQYYAIRIAFDKKLFDYLATKYDQFPDVLDELDNALLQLNLKKSKQQPLRSIEDRQKGTLKLFKKQIFLISMQLILAIVTVILGIST